MRPFWAIICRFQCAALLATIAAAGVAQTSTAREVIAVNFETGIDDAIHTPERFAIEVPYSAGVTSHGTWTAAGSMTTWHWEVQVPGAVSLSFHASRVSLPPGASLRVTGGNVEFTYGMASVHRGELWSRIAHGDTLSFDLTVNAADASAVSVEIVGLQAGFRSFGGRGPNHPYYDSLVREVQPDTGTTGCVENYECHITAGDLGPGQGSVAITVSNTLQCSAVLLNDVPGDGTPYLLTARHCENGNADGGDPGAADSVSMYFDATVGCGQSLGNIIYNASTYMINGATTVVEQQDTWLMRFSGAATVPDAYYSGWDATGADFAGGYTAHYGFGNDRQYTEWYGDAYYSILPGSELGLEFTSTFWDLVNAVGSVEPGASGSGVFDANNRLVGTLARAKLQGTQANSPGVCPVPNPPIPGPSTATAQATALSGVYDSTADPASTTGSVTMRSVLDPQNTGTLVVKGTWTPPVLVVDTTNPGTGSAITLSWSTTAGTSCTASGGEPGDGWGGAIAISGSQTVIEYAGGATTYVVTCYRGGFLASNRVTVNWTLATPAAMLNGTGGFGGTFTGYIGTAGLQWSANVTPCVASGGSPGDGWSGNLAASGTKTVTETVGGTYTYVLTCGTGTRTVTAQYTLTFLAPAASLSAIRTTTAIVGQLITLSGIGQGLSCATTGGAAGDGWAGNLPSSETDITEQITETTPGNYTYTFSCTADGQSASSSVTLTFVAGPPSVTLTALPVNPNVGGQVELSWVGTVTPCAISINGYVNETSYNNPARGTYQDQQYVIGAYTYTVTCGSGNATASASQTVNWQGVPVVSVQASASTVVVGAPTNVSWNSNAAPCSESGGSAGDGWSGSNLPAQGSLAVTETQAGTYHYLVTCGSAGQTATAGTPVVFDAGPVYATLTASATTGSTQGPPIKLTWISNTSPCERFGTTGYWGNDPSSFAGGSDMVLEGSPGTYTYVIQCGSGANTATAQVAVQFTGLALPMLAASTSYTTVGQPFTLTWSAGGPYESPVSCNGDSGSITDGWSGAQLASPKMQIVEPIAGTFYYGLSCGGVPVYATVMVLPESSGTPGPYDHSGQLDIPTLIIGDAVYSNVVVPISDLVSEPSGPPVSGNLPSYDPVTGHLSIPAETTDLGTYYNALVTLGPLVSIGSVSGADSYDGSRLTISSVQVTGGAIYSNVVVTIASIVGVAGGMPLFARDQYNPATRQLQIPAVEYAGHIYTNVIVTVNEVISIGN